MSETHSRPSLSAEKRYRPERALYRDPPGSEPPGEAHWLVLRSSRDSLRGPFSRPLPIVSETACPERKIKGFGFAFRFVFSYVILILKFDFCFLAFAGFLAYPRRPEKASKERATTDLALSGYLARFSHRGLWGATESNIGARSLHERSVVSRKHMKQTSYESLRDHREFDGSVRECMGACGSLREVIGVRCMCDGSSPSCAADLEWHLGGKRA